MKIELLLYIGGSFNLSWAVFDLFWPRLFNWKESLASLDDLQGILLPITTKMLVVFYLGVTAISFFHAADLINSDLGRSFMIFVALYWAVRASLQIYYFGFNKANTMNVELTSFVPIVDLSNKTTSVLLFSEFVLISALYFIPAVCS